MSRREIECSDRATTVGSTIESIIACYHRGMGPFTSFGPGLRAAILVSIVASTAGAAAKPDFLTAARQFYNQGQYDQALAAAKQAGSIPSTTSSARLIMGRARLERFRDTPVPQELDDARADLRAVDPHALVPRERIELQVGLGELLYLEDHFGPAAELLDPVVDLSATLAPDAHERAPARAAGDLDRAWAAAAAGWIRAALTRDRGVALRGDLDKLVTQGIIPDRAAKVPARERRQAAASLAAEWESFKKVW